MREIRQVGEESIDLIRQLAHAVWPTAYGDILTAGQIDYMLNMMYSHAALLKQIDEGHQFLIVYDHKMPVGFASYSPKENNSPAVYRLHKLYVLPDHQRKGTGKLLLDHIIAAIQKEGAMVLELNVNKHNKAFHFYARFGFTIAEEKDIDIGGGYFMNDYILEKKM